MQQLQLFTDGSVNNQSKIGYAAYLFISSDKESLETLQKKLKIKRFENTSSTKLELQILVYALNELKDTNSIIQVFTDSQNIISLIDRRVKMEKNNYLTKANKLIINSELYKEFYNLIDRFNCEFIKIKGHKKASEKTKLDQIFTLVDRASRKALRNNS